MKNVSELKDYLSYFRKNNICSVIAVANRKGGVSKTSSSTSLAYVLAQSGFRVLLIDSDPQQSASNILGVNNVLTNNPLINIKNIGAVSYNYREIETARYKIDDLFGSATNEELFISDNKGYHDLLTLIVNGYEISAEDLKKAIITPKYRIPKIKKAVSKGTSLKELMETEYEEVPFGFDLLPSSEELTDDEMLFTSGEIKIKGGITSLLSKITAQIKRINMYDVVLIDCPPSLGAFTLNAFMAADGTVIPVFPDQQSIYSLAKIKKNFRDIKRIKPEQKGILGVVLSAVSRNNVTAPIIKKIVTQDLMLNFYDTTIHQSVKAQQSASANMIFAQIDKKAGSEYEELACEVLQSFIDNDAWENYRNEQYEKAIEKIKSEELDLVAKLYEDAKVLINEEIKERNLDIASIKEDALKKIYDNKFNNLLKDEIIKRYDNGELWEARSNDFHFDIKENTNE